MGKKMSKSDEQFLITLNLTNRDFLTNCANMILSFLFSFTATMFSIYSIYISYVGFNINSLIVGLVFLISLAPYWVWSLKKYKKCIKNSKKINEQYQKYLFEIYPHTKEEYH